MIVNKISDRSPDECYVDPEVLEQKTGNKINKREGSQDTNSLSVEINCEDNIHTIDPRQSWNEAGMISRELSFDNLPKDVWIGDIGASTHLTNSLEGMTELRNMNSKVIVGSGDALSCKMIGTKIG